MPELPEVETVRRGLEPVMAGATIRTVELRRPDLRFPFPDGFVRRLVGARVQALRRRAKYILADTDRGDTLILHLGMSGRFDVNAQGGLARFVQAVPPQKHIHVVFELEGGEDGPAAVTYADPRRFGFMDIVPTGEIDTCRHFARMGPEPLGNEFSAPVLVERLAGRRAPLKAALLDQRVVAGLGNIYVCEALWRSGLSPRRMAKTVGSARAERLVGAIKDILAEAIDAGGSSLRDYVATDGAMGLFQHAFDVYDREGEVCRSCRNPVQRITQSGRSTFFCTKCQR